jgi:two-component system phosphate regulon sensor histidine kinase PhoR
MKGKFLSKNRNRPDQENGSGEYWRNRCETLQLQLDEMTKRNNERNNYINSVFSSMEDGFFLTDNEGRIVLFNKSAENLLDIHASWLFGENDTSHNAVMQQILSECKLAAELGCQPKTFEAKNGNDADIQISISRVMSKYGKKSTIGMLAIVKDITERKRVEKTRKDFVATVSHEFRTPLTLISGFIEMLRMYDNLPPEDKNRSLEILEIETERLKKLISELLLLSKMENKMYTEESSPVDVAEVLEQVITVLRPLTEKKKQALQTSILLDSPSIKGDETWLFHAIHNLVENAIKYTPEEGAILLEAHSDEKQLFITVSDNGIGIGPDDLDKIFERFYRVDQSRGSQTGGSGLGLAIAKDILSLFNGSISVSSEQGKGSTFLVQMPLDLI